MGADRQNICFAGAVAIACVYAVLRIGFV